MRVCRGAVQAETVQSFGIIGRCWSLRFGLRGNIGWWVSVNFTLG